MKICPAYAGMILQKPKQTLQTKNLSRVCGDDPLATEKDLLKTFKEILPKMDRESKAYLLGYGEGYKKKAEEAEKEDERKEEQNGTLQS